jgi:hypothetical protein
MGVIIFASNVFYACRERVWRLNEGLTPMND